MEKKSEEEENAAPLPPGWSKHWSKTHQAFYWFNNLNNTRSWSAPLMTPASAKQDGCEDGEPARKKRVTESGMSAVASSSSSSSSSPEKPKVAVIVPFRDLHAEQQRKQHLDAFVPYMSQFLQASGNAFTIYIVEQSDDGRKFNRGKLLNVGFELACREGCQVFIFHDVDLLPSKELRPWYTTLPSQPVHIARVWERYNDNPKYFGGIVAFSEESFRKINGFPNNFWGWGGEDDEMFNRITITGLKPTAPDEGAIRDLENMTLPSKLAFLKSRPKWKCMNKTEVLAEHSHWERNGLTTLHYQELQRTVISTTTAGSAAVRVTVDVLENQHWTDLVCRLEDTQFDRSVDELKASFAKSQKDTGKK